MTITKLVEDKSSHALVPTYVQDELTWYEEQIARYRSGALDETKMQKVRLHFGTYAQRQEGVQMQRIKIPGGYLTADQLEALADASDRFGSSFIHFTTREDAQIYYVSLDETPTLLRFLADSGITTREACGNTVRNITACYRAGTSATEPFDVRPYAESLFRYLVRNKFNQNLGRKFKITFEGCSEDHSALRIHDIGFWATTETRDGKVSHGFRVFLGGGLGASPHLAQLYTDFLPAEEIFNLAASLLRLFDRYGERKARMKARMKFLVQSLGWDSFVSALNEERERVGPIHFDNILDEEAPQRSPRVNRFKVIDSRTKGSEFQSWARDAVIEHKLDGYRGVHVRLKLGDITSTRARSLAKIAREFSSGELRTSIGQNVFLPWVHEDRLFDLHRSLKQIDAAEEGVGTVVDVTTCPGSDTCRLGIASAKGLGTAISDSFDNGMADYRELARDLKIKVSGCPNGCAQHTVANIGFHAAALSHDGHTVPAYLISLGGQTDPGSAQIAQLVGKFPARNCTQVIKTLLRLYRDEKNSEESFNEFVERVGERRIQNLLEPWRQVPEFADDSSFYDDYGHENERFAIRPQGVKGECAGSTVAESVPTIERSRELLAQGDAFFYHHEYAHVLLVAYEAAAAAARVPLYQRLVDPFTDDEALWEFENLFVLSGQTQGEWQELSSRFVELQGYSPTETAANTLLIKARSFVDYCDKFVPPPA
ncbi:MAG TPA: nitrite/sulfite reductase [Pyrinomonadaceae bacterium]